MCDSHWINKWSELLWLVFVFKITTNFELLRSIVIEKWQFRKRIEMIQITHTHLICWYIKCRKLNRKTKFQTKFSLQLSIKGRVYGDVQMTNTFHLNSDSALWLRTRALCSNYICFFFFFHLLNDNWKRIRRRRKIQRNTASRHKNLVSEKRVFRVVWIRMERKCTKNVIWIVCCANANFLNCWNIWIKWQVKLSYRIS